MRDLVHALAAAALLVTVACAGTQGTTPSERESSSGYEAAAEPAAADGEPSGAGASGGGHEFALRSSETADDARGASESKIRPSATQAAMKFVVVDKDKGPLPGIVISLTSPEGQKYYTEETDAAGYAEVLVPVGKKYELVYLSLGRRDIAATVPVPDEPNQNIKLTLRYKRHDPPAQAGEPRFILDGVHFDVGKATIRPESYPRLDLVVEFMQHKKSAHIEIGGHTDNVGDPARNKTLSEKRAKACRDYLISRGIDAARIQAIGHGDERPIASNETEAGRQKNRRIEAKEL